MLELHYIDAPISCPFVIAIRVAVGGGRLGDSLDRVILPSQANTRHGAEQRRAFAAARARGGLIYQVLGRYQASPIPWSGHSNRGGWRTGPGGEAR